MASLTFRRRRALLALAPALSGCASHSAAPTTLRVTLATMHAAALAAPQGVTGANRPYLLVSVVGPRARSAIVRAPETGEWLIHRDEVLRDRPLTDVRLGPGDSVRILVSVIEGTSPPDVHTTAMSSASIATSGPALASALGPLVRSGGRWLGSVSLRLTDEGGVVYWHGLECVETCVLLSGATDTPLQAPSVEPNVGTVELSGGGAKYHVKLSVQRM